jgi:23S rRNA pseudouridine2605 synthase
VSALRLARFLARAGVSSRRGAAELVAQDRVRINGAPPRGPGDPVDPARDHVTLDGRAVRLPHSAWIALHKPPGYVTSRKATARHPDVFSLVDAVPGLVAVGRLDVMSEGLLLFTTDGELAARLMHPRWQVPRRYRVALSRALEPGDRAALDRGVPLPDEERPVRPARWSFTPRGKAGVLEVEVVEGRSRVVRRLCAALGLGIVALTRIAYGPIALEGLARGAARPLTSGERDELYRAVSLEPPGAS